MEQIKKDIYRIPVPLPENQLKSLNCYLITGRRNLLIDTGFNRLECYESLMAALNNLEVDLDETDLFLTHAHGDHCGLAGKLAGNNSKVYCSQKDGALILQSLQQKYWDSMEELFAKHGFAQTDGQRNVEQHPGKRYNLRQPIEFTFVDENTRIDVGKYRFQCIETPGHTPGHMCLYEPTHGVFFSGDHILQTITPHISVEKDFMNPLQAYLESLEKVKSLPLKGALPSHRQQVGCVSQRCEELIKHHKLRLAEVLSLVSDLPASAYEIAAQMSWNAKGTGWEQYPIEQKWFAIGESMAHLFYLLHNGEIEMKMQEGIYVFYRDKII